MTEARWKALGYSLGGEPDEVIAALVRDLGLPSRISEVGVPEEDIDSISSEFGDSSGEVREILSLAR
jgi:alcohol dehydrogenase class IV